MNTEIQNYLKSKATEYRVWKYGNHDNSGEWGDKFDTFEEASEFAKNRIGRRTVEAVFVLETYGRELA